MEIKSSGEMPQQDMAAPAAGRVIGREEILKAEVTRKEYHNGKKSREAQVIENNQWYKLRHWKQMRARNTGGVQPTSGWLFNTIANKHADAMDNIPEPNILAREESDKQEAKMLSSIVPVVLEQADWEGTYDSVTNNKLIEGTGIYGIFWDADKLHGLGDISIREIDYVNLFWEPGVKDIQESRNVFCVELADQDLLEEQFPQCKGRLGNDAGQISSYVTEDSIDTSKKTAVVDWYYKKNGKLHYCKYVADVVLFASENEPEYAERGWYDHGMYPFVIDPLFRMKGSPCGFGLVDVAKSAQEYIDRGNQAILQNMLANTRPRHFIRMDGSVKEEEYADYTKDFVHVDGNLGQDSILPIQGKPLQGVYVNVIQSKIDELKEVTGNRDISTGGTASGVTAASAIAAMQEAGSKLSRDQNKGTYRSFRKIVLMVIELIRQFYDLPRCFRIIGEQGAMEYITFDNSGMQQQTMDGENVRVPLFDVDVTAQKQSPYSKMAQNELALQFYGAGFFNPQMADQALTCLDMMDFNGKDGLIQKIQQNGTLLQMLQQAQMVAAQLAAQLDAVTGGQNGAMAMQQMAGGMMGAPAQMAAAPDAEKQEALGGGDKESHVTRNARKRVADSTAPA